LKFVLVGSDSASKPHHIWETQRLERQWSNMLLYLNSCLMAVSWENCTIRRVRSISSTCHMRIRFALYVFACCIHDIDNTKRRGTYCPSPSFVYKILAILYNSPLAETHRLRRNKNASWLVSATLPHVILLLNQSYAHSYRSSIFRILPREERTILESLLRTHGELNKIVQVTQPMQSRQKVSFYTRETLTCYLMTEISLIPHPSHCLCTLTFPTTMLDY